MRTICRFGHLIPPFENRDRARFRAGIKTDTAAGASISFVCGCMIPVRIKLVRQNQYIGRAGFDTQFAPLALFGADDHMSSAF
jgi:hypothetical protein